MTCYQKEVTCAKCWSFEQQMQMWWNLFPLGDMFRHLVTWQFSGCFCYCPVWANQHANHWRFLYASDFTEPLYFQTLWIIQTKKLLRLSFNNSLLWLICVVRGISPCSFVPFTFLSAPVFWRQQFHHHVVRFATVQEVAAKSKWEPLVLTGLKL